MRCENTLPIHQSAKSGSGVYNLDQFSYNLVFLKALRLYNFKNYREVDLFPDPKLNCFLGKNGSGKTNLLDAIHYLGIHKERY
ncbi:MAG: AAA family ATPase [Cytophagales bacterium]|nr:AAA family ATPase [Cytophagales bacterium]